MLTRQQLLANGRCHEHDFLAHFSLSALRAIATMGLALSFDPVIGTGAPWSQMSTYRLDRLFVPRSIAVVGGSPRDTSPGRAVLKNLRSGGFAGEIHLVNSHYDSLEGIAAVKSCDALSGPPDIVVIGERRLRWSATPRRKARR
jgi:hypothetical protein